MRVSERDREGTVRALSEHTAAGRLSLDEFEERVGAVYTAQRVGELKPLLADLPQSQALVHPRHQADGHLVGRRRGDWGPWLLVGAICVLIWALTSIGSAHLLYFWPIWVIGPWGVSMLMRGVGSRTRADRSTG